MGMYVWCHIHSKQKEVDPNEPKEILQKAIADFKSNVRLIEGTTVKQNRSGNCKSTMAGQTVSKRLR